MSGADLTTITRDDYERSRRHGYAGRLSGLLPETRIRYEELGADGWQLAWEEGRGTVLRPVRIEGGGQLDV